MARLELDKQAGQLEHHVDGEVNLPPETRPALPLPAISRFRKLQLQISNWLDEIKGRLTHTFQYEIEVGTGFNLLPLFIAIGIVIYFWAPAEPSFIALSFTFLAMIVVLVKIELRGKAYYSLAICTTIICGMVLGKIAVTTNPTPIIERQTTANLTAIVLSVDQNRRGAARYVVQPLSIDGLIAEALPHRLRLSATSKHERFTPGEVISGLARMQPVSGPVYPGGYDFSFFAWFKKMGGSGFFMGAPKKSDIQVALSWKTTIVTTTNQFRQLIETRILNALPGTTGKIAIALVTGNKSGIPEDIQQSLRITGLAHILAISGLHMALVTLTVIWLIRAGLARLPGLALHYPIKKIAVCAGFFSATFYLFISGSGVATQRAWIMISVMLLAVLLDRRAITMRSVAISALLILALNPQNLFSPGFQMSFAAVASLVAGYEVLNKRKRLRAENEINVNYNHWVMRRGKQFLTYFGGIAVTSLIAGTATAFIAAWHFHQVAALGLITNVLAMPFVTIIIMPFVLASVLLMPYGLEILALTPVAFGIEQVVEISRFVESHSPAGQIGRMPSMGILCFGLFLASLTIPKTRLRYFSFSIVPLFFFFGSNPKPPDIMIAENGRAVAVKTKNGNIGLLNTRAGSFVTGIWEKAWAPDGYQKIEIDKEQCNKERCIHALPNGEILHLVYNPDLLQSSCLTADILIAPRLWWVNCRDKSPNLVLNRHNFEQYGMHAIYIQAEKPNVTATNANQYRIETALKAYTRPWHRNVKAKD